MTLGRLQRRERAQTGAHDLSRCRLPPTPRPSATGRRIRTVGSRLLERRVGIVALLIGVTGALALPAAAAAHGIGGRADLPIPPWLFVWTAAIVLVISFVVLGALWRTPLLENSPTAALPDWFNRIVTSRALEIALGTASVAGLGILLWAGFDGRQSATNNITPTFVYITFWLGLVPVSVIFGNLYSAINPWRAIGRGVGWATGRALGKHADVVPYPDWLGVIPAAAGLFAFGWLENVATNGQLPRNVAAAALVYTCFTLIGMAVFGVERWVERAEAFGVYFSLLSRISLFGRDGDTIYFRRPLSGLTKLGPIRGLVLLISVMIGTVSFDGFGEGPVWAEIAPPMEDFFDGSLGATGARLITDSIGMAAMVAVIFGFFILGGWTVRLMADGWHSTEARRRTYAQMFVHSLVPIAVAYMGAHFITLFLLEGQGIASLVSDPVGRGWDLFGTRGTGINFGLIGAINTWYIQVSMVVAGHVAALALAHDRALIAFTDPRRAARSQLGMLLVMIGLTCFALWLLNEANA